MNVQMMDNNLVRLLNMEDFSETIFCRLICYGSFSNLYSTDRLTRRQGYVNIVNYQQLF